MNAMNGGDLTILGGGVLLPDGDLAETEVTIADGRIASIGEAGARAGTVWDATGMMVLPGIVDLHGDAFERQIMPRPGVSFPLGLALIDTDRQMTANGITTAYHGVTYSWEPGLRGRDTMVGMLEAMRAGRDGFGCDTRFHLRFETYNLEAVEEVGDWMRSGQVDLLAFNDHTPSMVEKFQAGKSMARHAERTGMTEHAYIALAESLLARETEVAPAMEHLAEVARGLGIPMASHDDRTAETRRYYAGLGCGIAEFPLTTEASVESVRLGNPIVLGAPNVVRGGSHMGDDGINAAKEIAEGRGDVLVSDYYYPALAQAPFILSEKGIAEFGSAWRMVSTNPARAAMLEDRGEIAVGRRADLLLVSRADPERAVVAASLVAGRAVYRSGLV